MSFACSLWKLNEDDDGDRQDTGEYNRSRARGIKFVGDKLAASRMMASSLKQPMLLVAPDEFEFYDVEVNKPLTEYLSLTNTMDVPMTVSLRL